MTNEQKNREVAEWLGIPWHEFSHYDEDEKAICVCGMRYHACEHKVDNPDFTTDPGKLLREMKKKELLAKFIVSLLLENGYGSIEHADVIPIKYVTDTTGKLLNAVWEFGPEREGGKI